MTELTLIDNDEPSEYHINTDLSETARIIGRIGETNDDLTELLKLHGVATAAFLTAWNPGTTVLFPSVNIAAQDRLWADVRSLELEALPGMRRGRSGDRPPEPSFLILGISRVDATTLSQRYDQNCFVWITTDAAPELVLAST